MMVGRNVNFHVEKKPAEPGDVVLEVKNMTMASKVHKNNAVKNVSFQVRRGEIVCIAGIDGNGQTELVYGLTGLEPLVSGELSLCGQDITHTSIRKRSTMGMSHIPEDRHKHGLVLDYSLEDNMVLQRYFEPEFTDKAGFLRRKNIRGYAERLSSGRLQKPEDATEFGRKILAESRRLLTLIEDIIRLSRLDEGVRGEVTPVDLTALIQHCVQKLTPAAQNAQVSISASGNDPVLISGDHALLEEMLTNLLENGIKYNHAGGYVRLRAEMADGRAVVTVADNGVGIAPEDQQRVFERFYRVDKSRSKQTGGSGRGLSSVKHGAQVHHAQIAMQSALGEGTTITLTFPAQSSGKK